MPGQTIVESKSLRDYLHGFRDQKIGVEALAAHIRDDLVSVLDPVALTVSLTQDTHGGHQLHASALHHGGISRV